MTESATLDVEAGQPSELGYRSFRLGEFAFSRDEYFVSLTWPTGRHVMSADAFLRRSSGTWPGTSSTGSSTLTASSGP